LSGFIAYYGVASIILLGTVHGHFANTIYTTFVCSLLHSVGLVVTFVLLFLRFPSQMHKARKSSSATRTPSKTYLGGKDSDSNSKSDHLSNIESTTSSGDRSLSHLDSSSQLDADSIQLRNV
jgi:hypothetical protein